jgi:transposase
MGFIVAQVSKLLSDDLVSIAEIGLKKLGKTGVVANRLSIILAAKKHGITDVCRIHGISRTTLTSWIKRLHAGVIDDLKNKPKQPRSPLHSHKDTIRTWIEQNPNITIRELIIKARDELGVTICQTAMRRVVKKLNFSYITPRASHYKKDESSQEEFKKKSTSKTR